MNIINNYYEKGNFPKTTFQRPNNPFLMNTALNPGDKNVFYQNILMFNVLILFFFKSEVLYWEHSKQFDLIFICSGVC